MDAQSSFRSQPGRARVGECLECHERLSSRLLWPLHGAVPSEREPAALCFACIAVEMLRMAAGGLNDAPEPPGPTTWRSGTQ